MEATVSNKQLITNVGIGLAAASAGILARKTLQKSWEKVIGQPAPKDKQSENTDLKEAVTWAVVSGIGAGLARMAVQYALDKRNPKQHNKTVLLSSYMSSYTGVYVQANGLKRTLFPIVPSETVTNFMLIQRIL